MTQIILQDIQLFGYHGVHPLEKVTGTQFTVNLIIGINTSSATLTLEDTIDYADVFNILKTEFSQTEDLLENLAVRILTKIFTNFTRALRAEIVILKNNAPISAFQGRVGVQLNKERNDCII
jgi:7,8-dihydroneopterin aldolase/epimerase/oxygenase